MRKPLEIVHEDKLETGLLCKMGVDWGVSDVNISAARMDLPHAMQILLCADEIDFEASLGPNRPLLAECAIRSTADDATL
jgi:hypothetical protein